MEETPKGATSPRRLKWQFEPSVPTYDFFQERTLDPKNIWGLQEAVESFIFRVEHHYFFLWEAVVCYEQGLPLTAGQEDQLDDLIDFSDSDDEEILYIDDMPRTSESWHGILNKIAPHLLIEPYVTSGVHDEVKCDGWERLAGCLRKDGEGLSLPEGAASATEVVPAELRHKLRLQTCFYDLHGLGQDEEINLEEQPDRIDWFLDRLWEHKDSVEYFDLTLDSLMTRVILPDRDRPLFVKMMRESLGLQSNDEPIAGHLQQPPGVKVQSSVGRLSEGQIKQGILHPDRAVRNIAVRYFSESFSPDQSVMPLVIQAVETYGWRDAVSAYMLRHGLAQTDETLRWILSELAKDGDHEDEDWRRYRGLLLDLLAQTDANLLSRYESQITDTDAIDSNVREAITERIRLLWADPDICWTEFEQWCDKEKSKLYVNEVNLDEPCRWVEAIARHGKRYVDRVLSILQEEVEDFENHPMDWMEPLVVRLAGEMRLESAIPLIVKKLNEEGDLLCEECQRALRKIGNDKVVEEVCRNYSKADWSYRLFASGTLEQIHGDLVVTKCLKLLSDEEDHDVRIWLSHAVLRQFSHDGIEPICQLILKGPLDPEMRELRRELLTACTFMGVTFPEMEQWKKDVENDTEENKRFVAKRFVEPARDLDVQQEGDFDDFDEEPTPPPARQKVGRNDPCPCGSSKKYKKCCMRKQDAASLFD